MSESGVGTGRLRELAAKWRAEVDPDHYKYGNRISEQHADELEALAAAPPGGTIGLDGDTRRCCNALGCDNPWPCGIHPESVPFRDRKCACGAIAYVCPNWPDCKHESPAPPAAALGYCDRHRWLHAKDSGPTPPCRNWAVAPPSAWHPAPRHVPNATWRTASNGERFYLSPDGNLIIWEKRPPTDADEAHRGLIQQIDAAPPAAVTDAVIEPSAVGISTTALERIARGEPYAVQGICDCTHDDENCCELVGEFCPQCIAAVALRAVAIEQPSSQTGLQAASGALSSEAGARLDLEALIQQAFKDWFEAAGKGELDGLDKRNLMEPWIARRVKELVGERTLAEMPPAAPRDTELVAKILEVAQLHEDTDDGGTVFMPDEDEWGEIVGIARKLV